MFKWRWAKSKNAKKKFEFVVGSFITGRQAGRLADCLCFYCCQQKSSLLFFSFKFFYRILLDSRACHTIVFGSSEFSYRLYFSATFLPCCMCVCNEKSARERKRRKMRDRTRQHGISFRFFFPFAKRMCLYRQAIKQCRRTQNAHKTEYRLSNVYSFYNASTTKANKIAIKTTATAAM